MELGIAIVVVLAVGGYFIYAQFKRADKNADGKIDATEAKAVVEQVKLAADQNQDGRIDVEDAKVVVKKAAVKTKAAVGKAKSAVRNSPSKKPAAKK